MPSLPNNGLVPPEQNADMMEFPRFLAFVGRGCSPKPVRKRPFGSAQHTILVRFILWPSDWRST